MRTTRWSLLARGSRKSNQVARLDVDATGREFELGVLARGPEILQPGVGEALRLAPPRDDGRIRAGLPAARARQATRGDGGTAVIRLAIGEAELDLLRQLRFLGAREAQGRALSLRHEVVLRDGTARPPRPRQRSRAAGRDVDAEEPHQRFERSARRHRPVDHVAVQEAVDRERTGIAGRRNPAGWQRSAGRAPRPRSAR